MRLLCLESAGVDIKELKSLDFMNGFSSDFLRNLAAMFQDLRVPVIAAVKGFAVRSGSVYEPPASVSAMPEMLTIYPYGVAGGWL